MDGGNKYATEHNARQPLTDVGEKRACGGGGVVHYHLKEEIAEHHDKLAQRKEYHVA